MTQFLHQIERSSSSPATPRAVALPQAFIDWSWQVWLPANLHRYEAQVQEHINYLGRKIDGLNRDLEHLAGGVLDDRDSAADLRDRLQRELDARELVT